MGGGENKLYTSIITIFVIVMLTVSGPVSAVSVLISGLQTTYTSGSSVNFIISVEIKDPDMFVPVTNISIDVTGSTNINTTFALNGTIITGDPLINITPVSIPPGYGYGYAFGYGYGYGYDSRTGIGNNFGYTYGYGYGRRALTYTYNVTINSTTLPEGSYSVVANLNTVKNVKFSSEPAAFEILPAPVTSFDVVIDDFNRPDNSTIGNNWTEDVNQSISGQDIRIKNGQLELLVGQHRYGHIERKNNKTSITSGVKIYTSDAAGFLVAWSPKLYYYWDTGDWIGIGTNTKSNTHELRWSKNGVTGSVSKGTAFADNWYWYRLKVNDSGINGLYSIDGSVYTYLSEIPLGSQWNTTPSLIILGSGYNSSDSFTNSPDLDNDFAGAGTLIQTHLIDDFIVQPDLSIISWGNNRTMDTTTGLTINTKDTINFNASNNQEVTTWNWFIDGINQNWNSDNISFSWDTAGSRTVQVNATNNKGTSNTITWNVNVIDVIAPTVYISSDNFNRPDNSTIGNNWIEDVSQGISGHDIRISNNQLELLVARNRYGHIEGKNNEPNITSSAKIYTDNSAGWLISWSPKLYYYWDTDDWIGIGTNTKSNTHELRYSKNGVTGSVSTGTAFAKTWYWYMLKVNGSGIYGSYSNDGLVFTNFSGIQPGSQWNTTPSLVILGSGYNSIDSLTNDPDLDNDYAGAGTLIQTHFIDDFIIQPEIPGLKISSWGNNKTQDPTTGLTINVNDTINFNASTNQEVSTWNWFLDGINQNWNSDNISFMWETAGSKTVQVNATNINGTSNTITWNINVIEVIIPTLYVSSDDFNRPDNSTIGNNWTEDVNQSISGQDIKIKNGQLELLVGQHRYGHIEGKNNRSNITSSAKIYTSDSAGFLVAWSPKLYYYWDTGEWIGIGTNTKDNTHELRYSKNGINVSLSTGTAFADTWYWYKIKVNSSGVYGFYSIDGTEYNNFSTIPLGSQWNITPSLIILGSGYDSSESLTNNPNLNNDHFLSGSLIQTHLIDDFIVQPEFNIISWGNNRTMDTTTGLTINTNDTINFNATTNQEVSTWNWFIDGINQNWNFDNISLGWETAGSKTVQVNSTNNNGTSNTITWNINIIAQTIYISSDNFNRPDNSTIGNNWIEDVSQGISGQDIRIKNNQLELLVARNRYGHIEGKNNEPNITSSAKIYTDNSAGWLISWSPKLYYYWDTDDWIGIGTNTKSNNHELRYSKNGVTGSVSTGTAFAKTWYWYRLKVNGSGIYGSYSNDGSAYTNFSKIPLGNQWNTTPSLIILGSGYNSIDSTNDPDLDNDYTGASSSIQTHLIDDFTIKHEIPGLKIASWGNNKTMDTTTGLTVNVNETINFNASTNQEVSSWSWFLDGINQNWNSDNISFMWETAGSRIVEVNAANINGTSNTITWNVNVNEVIAPDEYISSDDFNRPDNSTIGNNWTEDVNQSISGQDVRIKNGQLELLVGQHRYGHIEGKNNKPNITSSVKIYTSDSAGFLVAWSPKLYYYWDTGEWIGIGTNTKDNTHELRYSKNGVNVSLSTGTAFADTWYWYKLKVNGSGIYAFYSSDGSVYTNLTRIALGSQWNTTPSLIILGSGYDSSESLTNNPDLDNDHFPSGSLVQTHLMDDFIVQPEFNIILWGNSRTLDATTGLTINTNESINFNATTNQEVSIWNWFLDGIDQNWNSDNISFSWETAGSRTLQVRATNNNGTSNTITWNINVIAQTIYISSDNFNRPDNSTIGNNWIEDVSQGISGHDIRISNNQLELLVARNRYGHIEGKNNEPNITSSAKIYTDNSAGWLISWSPKLYYYWDTDDWIGIGTNTKTNNHELRYSKNGVTGFVSTGTAFAKTWYWYMLKVNGSGIYGSYSNDGSVYTYLGEISLGNQWNTTPSLIILGSGYNSIDSLTIYPDLDNDYAGASSSIQTHLIDDFIIQPEIPGLNIISWGNNKTQDPTTSLTINVNDTINFNASTNQEVSTWNWFLDGINQNWNSDNISFMWETAGSRIVEVNAANINGTSNTITWNVNVNEVIAPDEYISSDDFNRPDNSTIGNNWIEEVNQSITGQDVRIKNGQLELLIGQHRYGHIEGKNNKPNITSSAKIYTSDSAGFLVAWSPKLFYYWDTGDWIGIGTNTKDNAHELRYSKNGVGVSLRTGTAFADTWYRYKLKVNGSGVYAFYSSDGSVYTNLSGIPLGSKWNTTPSLIILGSGYNSSESPTSNPDLDNDHLLSGSVIQTHLVDDFIVQPEFNIISWGNNKTLDTTTGLTINTNTGINFNASTNQEVTNWNWFIDGINQNWNSDNFSFMWETAGSRTVQVNATNNNGTSNTITWNINVIVPTELISNDNFNRPDNSIIGNNWIEDVSQGISGQDIRVKNNQLELLVARNRYGHIEGRNNEPNITSSARIYTDNSAGWLISWSPKLYYYWDTDDWIGIGTNTKSNNHELRYSKNGVTGSVKTGTALAKNWYWYMLKVNGSGIYGSYSNDGLVYTNFSGIQPGSQWNSTPSLIILGSGYNSIDSLTNDPDLDNDYSGAGSSIQTHLIDDFIIQPEIPGLNIISWGNNKTLDSTTGLTINVNDTINFNASANQEVSTWNWFLDGIDQNWNSDNISFMWETAGSRTVQVNAANINGTSNTITWNINVKEVIAPPELISSDDFNRPDNSTIGNNWTEDVNQSVSGQDIRIKNGRLELLVGQHRYGHIERKNNNQRITSSVKIYTSDTAGFLVAWSPKLYYYWDTGDWIGIGTNTKDNNHELRWSKNGLRGSLSTGTAFASTWYWYKFKLNSSGVYGFYSNDGAVYTNLSRIPLGSQWNTTPSLIILGSGDNSSDSFTNNPDLDNDHLLSGSVIQIHLIDDFIVQPELNITSWGNTKTLDSTTSLNLSINESINLYATMNQEVSSWNWLLDGINQNWNSDNISLRWETPGSRTLQVHAVNNNGTSNTITWDINVVAELISSDNFDRPANSTIGNRWIEDVNQGITGQDIRINNNQLEILVGRNRYGHIEGKNNKSNTISSAKIYTSNSEGWLISWSPKLYYYWDTGDWIGLGTNTKSNSHELRYSKNGVTGSVKTGTAFANTWYWYKLIINGSGLHGFYSNDGVAYNYLSQIPPGSQWNTTPPLIILGSGYNSTESLTSNPDLDNDYAGAGSSIQIHKIDDFVLEAGIFPTITSWRNNKTGNNSQTLTINVSEVVNFNATVDQVVTNWQWYIDDIEQTNNYDNLSAFWKTPGTRTVKVKTTNDNGTSNTVIWTVNVITWTGPGGEIDPQPISFKLSKTAPYSNIPAQGTPNWGSVDREFIQAGHNERIRQNGTIYQLRFAIADVSNLTQFNFTIWRKNGSNYDRIAITENLINNTSNGINVINLSSPIEGIREGDFYGYRIKGSGNSLYVDQGNTNHLAYYVDGGATTPINYDWKNQISEALVYVIEPYMENACMVFIGDSIIAGHGHGLTPDEHFSFIEHLFDITNIPATIENHWSIKVDKSYQNMGIGGQTTDKLNLRFNSDVVDLSPEFVLIEGGVNDVNKGRGSQTILNNWESMIQKAISNNITPVVLLILPWTSGSDEKLNQITYINEKLVELASNYSPSIVVDASCYVGINRPSGPPGNCWDIDPSYTFDGMHYNSNGSERIAQAIKDSFRYIHGKPGLYNLVQSDGSVIYNLNLSNSINTSWSMSSKGGTANVSYNTQYSKEIANFTINSGTIDWFNIENIDSTPTCSLRISDGTLIESTQAINGNLNFTTDLSPNSYYVQCPDPPAIVSWYNNKTKNNNMTLTINTSETVLFNATANKTITTWKWYKDNSNQNNDFDNFSSFWDSEGVYSVAVSATDENGTSNLIQWQIIVNKIPIFIFDDDFNRTDNTTIGNNWTEDVNQSISGQDIKIKNNQLEISAGLHRYGHIERNNIDSNVTSSVKIFTNNTVGWLISWSPKLYYYWDTGEWVGIGTNTRNNNREMRWSKNGVKGSVSTGTASANTWYWYKLKVDDSGVYGYYSLDGISYSYLSQIQPGSSWNNSPSLVIVGSGYNSTESTTFNPDLDNDHVSAGTLAQIHYIDDFSIWR